MEIPVFQTVVRLLIPLSILRFPLIGILLAMLVDMYDWKFVSLATPEQYNFYQNWDKALDFYYQLFIIFIVFRFKDEIAKKTAIFLFLYRIAGLLLFYVTQNRNFLLLFPNIFENFVIFYLLYVFIAKKDILFTSKKILAIVLAVLTIPKIIHEYFQHFLVKQPWELYDIGMLLGTEGIIKEYINYLSWGIILYVIPIGIALYFLSRNKLR